MKWSVQALLFLISIIRKTASKPLSIRNIFRGEPKIDKIIYKVMSDPTAVDMAIDKGEIHIMHGTSDPFGKRVERATRISVF